MYQMQLRHAIVMVALKEKLADQVSGVAEVISSSLGGSRISSFFFVQPWNTVREVDKGCLCTSDVAIELAEGNILQAGATLQSGT